MDSAKKRGRARDATVPQQVEPMAYPQRQWDPV